jgi:hypothetical protein
VGYHSPILVQHFRADLVYSITSSRILVGIGVVWHGSRDLRRRQAAENTDGLAKGLADACDIIGMEHYMLVSSRGAGKLPSRHEMTLMKAWHVSTEYLCYR